MSEMTFRIIEILLPAVLGLIGAALYFATAYLRSRAEAIKSEDVRRMVWDILDRSRISVYDAVAATSQTYVDELRQANEDGKITEKEASEARRRAFEHFKALIGEVGLQELESIVGDVSSWFQSILETAVNDIKGK